MKHVKLAGLALAASALSACTTTELAAFSAAMSEASYNASYNAPYSYGSGYSPYGSRYGQRPAGTWVGYNQCLHTGSLYQCDSNGDGWADSFGDADDGSYTSTHLKINGKGEGFTRGEDGKWERNRAYDTSDRDDHDHHRRHKRD